MSKQPKTWSEARRLAQDNLAAISDEEDAAITADALADPDNPPITELPRRGRPPLEETKQAVKLRLDPDVVRHFRDSGPGWQTRMNLALREYAGLTDGRLRDVAGKIQPADELARTTPKPAATRRTRKRSPGL